jgi:hypothetical protein
MKKITIFTLMMLLALSTLLTVTVKAVEMSVENSESCLAGTDNDGDFLTGVADPDCAAFATTTPAVIIPETSESCLAGTDNDGDFLTGVADPDCAAFATTTPAVIIPETSESCLAGTDNDGDFLTGVADPDCAAFATTTPTTGGGTSGLSFGGGSSGGSSSSFLTSGTPISTIVSTSTGTCADMFTTYMRKGDHNNVSEVKKLQKLLNVKITGFFGNLTHNAVNAFQLKYTDSVLAPWEITKPTGYFYKTTQRQMNLLLCPTAEIPMPVLN